MKRVRIKKDEALKIAQDNLHSHQLEYAEAAKDYRALVSAAAEEHLVKITDWVGELNDDLKTKCDLKEYHPHDIAWDDIQPPVSYACDYRRVIRMLEMSVDDEIELTEEEFSNIILDDWNWKRNFARLNSNYKMSLAKYVQH